MRARFERDSLRQRRIRFVAVRRGIAIAVLLAGCGGRAAAPAKDNGCRAVARAAERWVAGAPAAQQGEVLRFAVEVIDLCQRPGLGPLARTCVSGAPDPAAARGCAGLGLVNREARGPLFPHAAAVTDEVDELDADDE